MAWRGTDEAYAGPDIERAHYYPYDLECLIDPEVGVVHYEVVHASGASAYESHRSALSPAHPLYVVGVADAGRRDGFTAAWVMQV